MTDLPITIRALRDTDKAFILDSWVNSARYSTPAFFWVPASICKSIYRKMVNKLIEIRPELFRVLVNEDDADQIFAWSCTEGRVTHFVYVKEEFRRERLASMLFTTYEDDKTHRVFTHFTTTCEQIGSIEYKPSLFKELINGLNETLGSRTAEKQDHPGESSGNPTDRRNTKANTNKTGVYIR